MSGINQTSMHALNNALSALELANASQGGAAVPQEGFVTPPTGLFFKAVVLNAPSKGRANPGFVTNSAVAATTVARANISVAWGNS